MDDGSNEQILILSKDGDFKQLQRFANVKQFDPISNVWITTPDPGKYLLEHIMRGEPAVGDAIPNVFSPDDSFVMNKRQKSLTKGRMEALMRLEFESEDVKRNFERNRMLIDLSYIPNDIKAAIMNKYNETTNKDRSKLMNYFIEFRLKTLMSNINDF